MRKLAVAALAGILMAAPAKAEGDIFGLWLVESGEAIVDIQPCGDQACGNFVWLQNPTDANGQPRLDVVNEDESLRNRPVCGLQMMGGFTKGDDGRWKDGWAYNSKEGWTAKGQMHLREDDTLYLRGYVGIPLFGKSQIWTRAADNQGGC